MAVIVIETFSTLEAAASPGQEVMLGRTLRDSLLVSVTRIS